MSNERIEALRAGVIGNASTLQTPLGERPLVYADYTASGRAVDQIEWQIERLSADYANPHTEDSETGRRAGRWLKEAEAVIKASLNAGPDDCLIACGAGATSAIHKLQQILGIALPPASRARIDDAAGVACESMLDGDRPVVFVGPYEHHSNELSWRESLAEVVSIGLTACGAIDLDQLERELADPRWSGRRKIGAFSAASNVTGVKTDVIALSRLLHAHGAILCLDCAASAPYLPIDMHPADAPDAAIDAVYFSPHKFVGGPGACGVLAFNSALYRRDLPPTLSAGGTVKYVWKSGHDFIDDIEARERAGTPGVPQVVRAGLALRLQAEIGHDLIAAREHAALERVFSNWEADPAIDVLGPSDPDRRIGIVAFNLRKPDGTLLHPRLVTVLLNDFFGIQTRAGCSCAGPYGHDLLGIDDETTQSIRQTVLDGEAGARPGWCRLSLHWLMDDAELDYITRAVRFLAREGAQLEVLYDYDPASGAWRWSGSTRQSVSLFPESILAGRRVRPAHCADRETAFQQALTRAEELAGALSAPDMVSDVVPEMQHALRAK